MSGSFHALSDDNWDHQLASGPFLKRWLSFGERKNDREPAKSDAANAAGAAETKRDDAPADNKREVAAKSQGNASAPLESIASDGADNKASGNGASCCCKRL